MSEAFGRGRVTDRRLDMRLKENRDKERPADQSGQSPTVSRALAADASGKARPSHQPSQEHNPQRHPSLIGQSETEYDRLQRRVGLVGIENEVLRDLLGVAWSTIGLLSSRERNPVAEALRARIWAHLHEEEAECPACDHYVVNHGAAGPCAVEGCDCQGNDDYSRGDINGTSTPSEPLVLR